MLYVKRSGNETVIYLVRLFVCQLVLPVQGFVRAGLSLFNEMYNVLAKKIKRLTKRTYHNLVLFIYTIQKIK